MRTEGGSGARADRPGAPKWMLIGALVGGVMLFAMVVLLALTLAQLRDSGGHIEAQDKKIAALFQLGRPLAARADDLQGEVGPALRDAQSFVDPLLAADSGRDLAEVLDSFPLLDSSLRRLAAEAVPALDQLAPALEQLDPALLTVAVGTLGELGTRLAEGDRLVRLIDGASAALADVGGRDLVARAARSATRLRKLLAVQRQTRALQARSLRVQRRSLEVQERTLDHVRSLDRKTLGELPRAR